MTKFKVGDVVYLKSDLTQKMTVRKVETGGVTCIWFGLEKRMYVEYLVPETLVLDTEIKKLKAKMLDTEKHCKEVEESNRELRNAVRDLEKINKSKSNDAQHWKDLYDNLESRYREYRDWLAELGLIEKSNHRTFKTREEWIKIREQEK